MSATLTNGAPTGAALRLALAMAIAGTIGLFVRESGVGTLAAVSWRCAIGLAAMIAYCWWTGALRSGWGDRRDLCLVLVGGVAIVVNWVLAFEAFHYVSITLMTIVYHVQPFFVLGLVFLAYGERTSRAQLAWVGLAFVGLVLAVGADPGLHGDPVALLIGVGLSLAAAFLYGVTVVAAKGIRGTKPEAVTLAHTVIGVVLLAPFAPPDISVLLRPYTATWLIGLGVLHTGLVYVLMYGAYPRLPGAVIAVLSFVYPATAILTDALVYRTPVQAGQVAGIALIAFATIAIKIGWAAPKTSMRSRVAGLFGRRES